ncbi:MULTISPECIES: hypothetical protein [Nitrospirillum]|uniref:Sulfotransferase domain-containing protein n=1 Tax=Nitrospirillum amazonense TaxID=28077 RepID=A0A560G6T0_9PROT|nr:hypothetical protein [Nitrospirillum amazonense]MEC4593166.1 hypothetical protein [Nitrospirillum amazonense]TWB29616.1 hypothetical protein FBZ88_10338 [Nitrospirillum amazonense]
MRLLVHGMQSSGATAFTRALAERPGCVALADIPNNFAAPRVTTTADFVAKVVVTTAYPLATHVERFRPDKVVLFLRDPRDNYASLSTANYRHHSGLMDEKFLILDQLFAERHRLFDAVIHYEDFVAREPSVFTALAALGWPLDEAHYTFRRDYNDLLRTLWEAEPALQETMDVVFGNTRGAGVTDRWRDKPRDPAIDARLEILCPRLLRHYQGRPIRTGQARSVSAKSSPL